MKIAAGCDPGLVNFGFSVVSINKSKRKVLHYHMVKNRVTDLKKDVIVQSLAFYKEIKHYLIKYKPSVLVAERFMVRGRFGQSIAECLSFMLGILALLCNKLKIELKLVVSAAWKNSFARAVKPRVLNDLYKFLKPLPPHIIDSVLQAEYGLDEKYVNWSNKHLKKARIKWQRLKKTN